ncbi:alpha/beta hydrolase family protein [Lentzea sp. NPDC059081]|uniref:alpha/beta hydrolase family protein n=1 Tax=Lentzea sp. NPDC059081 TaxID=3346719 RepID=UPI003699DB17
MRRLLGVALSFLLVVTAAHPAAADRTRGDEPLPGYTIDNPPLAPAQVGGKPTRVLQGVHSHAGYVIEVPPHWNGRLALWAHGYRGTGKVLTVDTPGYGLRQRWLDEGYAWAASSYYANAYDVRAGVTTTRELATLFGQKVQRPKKVFLAGVSMGGHVIARSLEQYPGFYDGALPMCGVVGDHELFDYFLSYHLVAQTLTGIRAYPFPADYQSAVVPRIRQALAGNDAQFRALVADLTGGARPGTDAAYAYWQDFLYTLVGASTNPNLAENPQLIASNLTTRYRPNSPVNVNATVQRVRAADPVARNTWALTEIPAVQGLPTAPVVSLHGIGDLFVPFKMEQDYRDDAARFGRTNLLVQRAIRTVDHCEFSPAEAGDAWRDLTTWVDRGKRPAGDDIRRTDDPRFGCRFSDRQATGGTRALYPTC